MKFMSLILAACFLFSANSSSAQNHRPQRPQVPQEDQFEPAPGPASLGQIMQDLEEAEESARATARKIRRIRAQVAYLSGGIQNEFTCTYGQFEGKGPDVESARDALVFNCMKTDGRAEKCNARRSLAACIQSK